MMVSTVGQGISGLWKCYLDFIMLLTWWEVRNVTCRLGTHLWLTTLSWCPGFFFLLLSLNKKRGRQREVGDHTAPTFSVCRLRNIGTYWTHTVPQFLSSGLCLYDLKESPKVLSLKCGQIKKRMYLSFFFRCDDEIVWQEQLQGERAGFGSQFKDTGHHDWEVTAAQLESVWSHDIWRQEVESDGCS